MLLVAALATACWLPSARAQNVAASDPLPPTSPAETLQRRGSITLRNATLIEWLFAIQKEWQVDIVGGSELEKETFSGAFTEKSLQEVLTAILFARGYGYRQVGQSLLVIPLADMTIRPDQQAALLPLDLLDPAEIKASVQLLLSAEAKVEAVPSSKSLFVVGTADEIQRVRRFLEEAEAQANAGLERERGRARQPTVDGVPAPGAANHLGPTFAPFEVEEHIRIFQTQYVSAESLAETLQTLLVDARVSTFGDPPVRATDGSEGTAPLPNRVVVIADPQTLEAAARFIQQADVPRPQVRITAYMYDVNVEIMEQLGVNWSHAVKGRINGSGDPMSLYAYESRTFALAPAASTPTTGTTTGTTTTPAGAAAAVLPGQTGSLLTLDYLSTHFDFTALIRLFEQTDGARLLARPNIVAYDGVQAQFASVQEIPVQQLTQTDAGGAIGTTEFREAGITLRVTPRITSHHTIVLEVTPEFSLLSGFSATGQPIIDRRNATTKLELRDGEAAVIGGLVRRNEIETQTGVPGLMYWKHLGWLFRDHETTVTESELVVFIRAEIVGPSFPGDLRDFQAHNTVNDLVDAMPEASPAPIIPPCGDPHCPYHNPRLRVGGEFPCSCLYDQHHPWEIPPAQPPPGPEWQPPLPPTLPERLPPPTSQDLRAPSSSATPNSGSLNPPPANAAPIPPPGPATSTPPVVVDPYARRGQGNRPVLSRLPQVTSEAPRRASYEPAILTPNRSLGARP